MNNLQDKLHYTFQNRARLEEALTHKSAGKLNNERLEFLGDAVLNLVIADALLKQHCKLKEGVLSRMRADLVKGETLAKLAQTIDLGAHIKLGAGERKSGGQARTSILADALEAILGAVYLDGGIVAAQKVTLALYENELKHATPRKDAKTTLQESLQARKQSPASYEVTKTLGKQHDKAFYVSCTVGKLQSEGHGKTRKAAEQLAAQAMLEKLKKK